LGLKDTRQVAVKLKVDALCLDMENVPYVDSTLKLFRDEGHHHVDGLQSLYRTTGRPEQHKALSRLIEGAFMRTKRSPFRTDEGRPETTATGLPGTSGGATVGVHPTGASSARPGLRARHGLRLTGFWVCRRVR